MNQILYGKEYSVHLRSNKTAIGCNSHSQSALTIVFIDHTIAVAKLIFSCFILVTVGSGSHKLCGESILMI